MAKGLIRWNPKSGSNGRYELVAESNQSEVVTRSKYLTRMISIVENQENAARQAKIDTYSIISRNPKDAKGVIATTVDGNDVLGLVTNDAAEVEVDEREQYNIDEKFGFMSDMIDMVINKSAKSMLITGKGGIGKTWTVLNRLNAAGLIDSASVMPNISDLDRESIVVEDDEEAIEAKALAEINRPRGDYVIVKGRVTAKACYRLLYENRNRMIIFDDCDSVLQSDDCVNLLKAALDTYEDRYVSWRTEQAFGESDLPQSFKFEGSIVFISNLPMNKVDEAVRTRCFKVDVSMNTAQRIERMRSVLTDVMPEVDMQYKEDAIRILDENKHLTEDINFRSLMNTITIRLQDKPNWDRLAKFALLEQ